MDLFLLCGTRLEGAPEQASNRLYRNNRDGTFTDVTESSGLHAVGWANSATFVMGLCAGVKTARSVLWPRIGILRQSKERIGSAETSVSLGACRRFRCS